jgi:ribosomal protein L40E
MTGPAGTEGDPPRATRPAPLSSEERRWVALAAVAPIGVAALVLAPVAWWLGAGPGEVVGAAVVYGGLLGLAAAFVTVDRLQDRQCSRCRTRNPRGTEVCPWCGYDLVVRPRYTCDERHAIYLEAGSCACGLRLRELPTARGFGPQVLLILRIGGALLAFLVVVAAFIQVLERAL